MPRFRACLAACLLGAAGAAQAHSQSPGPTHSAVSPARYLDQFVDSAISPRNDFYGYAVGKWLRDHPIPKSENGWGVGDVVQEETYRRLLDISKTAAADPGSPGTSRQKIGDFWHAAMDTVAIAKQGYAPLDSEFARIATVKDLPSLVSVIARLNYIGADAVYGLFVDPDSKHSERNAAYLWQGGLGLPDRDYYFDADENGKKLRKAYVEHIARMLTLLGEPRHSAAAQAATVMAIETELAGGSLKLEALRDPVKNYNPMSLARLGTLTPAIDWKTHLADRGIRIDSVIVGQPGFFRQVETSLRSHSIAEWKTYLRWCLANRYAVQAGGRFDDEDFRFYGTILNGTPEQRPRWKRMLDQEENYLGDALGQLYVARYFSPATRQRYERLTDDIFAAFERRIETLAWMSSETKTRALVKLHAVDKKVGYPERWKDYSKYAVDRHSFILNAMRGQIWRSDYENAKVGKPVDRTEWGMTPQTYNAYYSSGRNEIVLPAAAFILPGIADSLQDDALVYSYAGGATVGHEITHGFDDEGRQFDERGNLENWWTRRDETEFTRRARGIVRQFNDYVAVGTLHVNGETTQGENIADLGGLTLGWDAFTRTRQYKEGKKIGGFTPAQRFFIGWALGWMRQLRPEFTSVLVKSDVHAPSKFRVIGPISNLDAFYEAFGVRAGDRMYRPDSVRVRIW
jgi:putative endopeptidase